MQEWSKPYYGTFNATLVIAGDIDAKTAQQEVEKYFGDIPAAPPIAHQNVWVGKMTGVHPQQVQDRVPVARASVQQLEHTRVRRTFWRLFSRRVDRKGKHSPVV